MAKTVEVPVESGTNLKVVGQGGKPLTDAYEQVPVTSAGGEVTFVDKASVPTALSGGSRISTNAELQNTLRGIVEGEEQAAKDAMHKRVLQGTLENMGINDPLAQSTAIGMFGGLDGSTIGAIPYLSSKISGLVNGPGGEELGKSFWRNAEEQGGKAYGAGSMLGTVAGAALTGGGSLEARAGLRAGEAGLAEGIGYLAKTNPGAVAGVLAEGPGRALGGGWLKSIAARGATEGAVYGAAEEAKQSYLNNREQDIQRILYASGTGALMGAGLSVGIAGGAKALASAAPKLGAWSEGLNKTHFDSKTSKLIADLDATVPGGFEGVRSKAAELGIDITNTTAGAERVANDLKSKYTKELSTLIRSEGGLKNTKMVSIDDVMSAVKQSAPTDVNVGLIDKHIRSRFGDTISPGQMDSVVKHIDNFSFKPQRSVSGNLVEFQGKSAADIMKNKSISVDGIMSEVEHQGVNIKQITSKLKSKFGDSISPAQVDDFIKHVDAFSYKAPTTPAGEFASQGKGPSSADIMKSKSIPIDTLMFGIKHEGVNIKGLTGKLKAKFGDSISPSQVSDFTRYVDSYTPKAPKASKSQAFANDIAPGNKELASIRSQIKARAKFVSDEVLANESKKAAPAVRHSSVANDAGVRSEVLANVKAEIRARAEAHRQAVLGRDTKANAAPSRFTGTANDTMPQANTLNDVKSIIKSDIRSRVASGMEASGSENASKIASARANLNAVNLSIEMMKAGSKDATTAAKIAAGQKASQSSAIESLSGSPMRLLHAAYLLGIGRPVAAVASIAASGAGQAIKSAAKSIIPNLAAGEAIRNAIITADGKMSAGVAKLAGGSSRVAASAFTPFTRKELDSSLSKWRGISESPEHPAVKEFYRFDKGLGEAAQAQVSTMSRNIMKKAEPVVQALNPGLPGVAGKGFQPKGLSYQEQALMRYIDAVENPDKILKLANTGGLTSDHMDALRENYRHIYDDMLNKLITEMGDRAKMGFGKAMPMQKRAMLSMIMGAPVDYTTDPKFQAKIQETFVTQEKQEQQAPPQGSRMTPPDLETESQRIEQ